MAVESNKPSEETPLLVPNDTADSSDTEVETGQGVSNDDTANQSVGATRATLIILSLWILIFLQSSNMSGLTTTQSIIAGDLDAYAEASWFTSSYLIALSSIAPLAGKLAQMFAPRNLTLVSACLFGIGGLVTGLAPTFAVFICGRVIGGIGAAGIMTISLILVLELTSKKKRGLFIGLVNAGYTSGVALGAMLAGALVPIVGWRALFIVQTPLSIIAGLGVFFSIPKSFETGGKAYEDQSFLQKLAKIDYLGAITLSSTIVLLLYGLSSPKIQWLPIGISAVTILLFVCNEIYYAQHPIIPIIVLSSRGALFTCLAQLLFMASRWTVLFYTPAFAISIKGWTPASAGSILIPTNLGFALGGLLAGWLHIKRAGSFYVATLTCFAVFAATLLTLSLILLQTTPPVVLLLLVFVNGFFTGASLNYTLAQILHLSAPSTHFIVTSLLSTFRGFAGSFGSAIGSGIFGRILKSSLVAGLLDEGLFVGGNGKLNGEGKELVRRLLGSPALVPQLEGLEKVVAIKAYEAGFRGLYMSAAGCALIAFAVQAAAGWKKGNESEVAVAQDEGDDE